MKRKVKSKAAGAGMALVHPNAAAVDIGATMHMTAMGADRASDPVRSFGTFTGDLHRLVDWFAECGVTTVVMESTSVYWIPIYELLDERGFEVFLVNARDAKHVPGRKTDVSDAQWLSAFTRMACCAPAFDRRATLLNYGPICASANACWTPQPPISSICRRP
jgi:transposase